MMIKLGPGIELSDTELLYKDAWEKFRSLVIFLKREGKFLSTHQVTKACQHFAQMLLKRLIECVFLHLSV